MELAEDLRLFLQAWSANRLPIDQLENKWTASVQTMIDYVIMDPVFNDCLTINVSEYSVTSVGVSSVVGIWHVDQGTKCWAIQDRDCQVKLLQVVEKRGKDIATHWFFSSHRTTTTRIVVDSGFGQAPTSWVEHPTFPRGAKYILSLGPNESARVIQADLFGLFARMTFHNTSSEVLLPSSTCSSIVELPSFILQ
jgi:hypothetical protein